MKTLLLKIFPAPTFESITSGLRKTITKLNDLAAANKEKAGVLTTVVIETQNAIFALNNESARAAATASKLRNVLGD